MPESANQKKYPQATRFKRFLALLIDDAIASLLILPIFLYFDVISYIEQQKPIPADVISWIMLGSIAAYLVTQSYLLLNYGQTIGKRVMGIAIATYDYQLPTFNKLIGLRYLPFRLISLVPIFSLVPIIDYLWAFFHPKQKCLHDILAGTQVIDIKKQTT